MKCSECNGPIRPVVAIDIDGTLGDYYTHFEWFAELYTGKRWPPTREMPAHKYAPSLYTYEEEYSDYLQMRDKQLYREIKLAYRQGGMKRSMNTYPSYRELIAMLRANDVEVWIATTRPYLRLDNIDPDTRFWLERHSIFYDGLIYGDNKYEQLYSIVGRERVIGVLDDLPEQYDQAKDLGLDPILKRNYHHGSALRLPWAKSLPDAKMILMRRVEQWSQSMSA